LESGFELADRRDDGPRQKLRLIEAALPPLAAMQRHRDHQHIARGCMKKRRDLRRDPRRQASRNRLNTVIFQEVNELAEWAFVGPKGDSAMEVGWDQFTGVAKLERGFLFAGRKLCDAEVFAAADTQISVLGY
jgi:hypothetical protein